MLSRISQGTEQFEAKKEALAAQLTQAIIGCNNLNTKLDDGQWALSTEEEITMHDNALTLIHMLCPDNNYGIFQLSLIQAYKSNSFLSFEKGHVENGLKYLKYAVDSIISFETTNHTESQTYTSLLMQDKPYGKVYFTRTPTLSAGLLQSLEEQPFYEKIKDNTDFLNLINRLGNK